MVTTIQTFGRDAAFLVTMQPLVSRLRRDAEALAELGECLVNPGECSSGEVQLMAIFCVRAPAVRAVATR